MPDSNAARKFGVPVDDMNQHDDVLNISTVGEDNAQVQSFMGRMDDWEGDVFGPPEHQKDS